MTVFADEFEEFFDSLGFHEVPKDTATYKLYTGCINCTKYANPFTCPEKAMVLDLKAHRPCFAQE